MVNVMKELGIITAERLIVVKENLKKSLCDQYNSLDFPDYIDKELYCRCIDEIITTFNNDFFAMIFSNIYQDKEMFIALVKRIADQLLNK